MICYVKSLGLFMFIQFIEYSLLFLIIGHPYWLVLGILIGIFTVLPYIGGLLSNLIAITSAFMISKELFYLTLFVSFSFLLLMNILFLQKFMVRKMIFIQSLPFFYLVWAELLEGF